MVALHEELVHYVVVVACWAFKISLRILFDPGDLPSNRFWRNVSYIILVNDVACGGNVEEVLSSSMKSSFVCHGYW